MSGVTEGDRRWLSAAIELSRLAPPTPTNYAVGAVVVDHDGRAGLDLSRATVYSSLEPCTARKSRPGTCADLILAAGVRRVVIALREPLIFVDCHGVENLRAGGAEVIEIPDLGQIVRQINAHVLDLRPADGLR
jgi:diaminohydroxyphosphoribosylaminopyrimidine deaminase/5-amino-6-(5-phosphoribosylamino)uracil reductase